MNALADFVKNRIAELNIAQKVVELRFLEECSEKLEKNTVKSKLSKLVNGDDEGIRFVEPDHRLTALARALELSPGVLSDVLRVTKEVVHLVLDARLPPDVVAFLRAQEKAAPTFRVVERMGEDCTTLRDEARQHALAWVVVADHRDAKFLEGADLKWTGITKVPRGWRLDKAPDLVPLPPPPPPRLFDYDGTPMVPCEALVDRLSKETYDLESLRRRVEALREIPEVPTFTLDELLEAEEVFYGLFGPQPAGTGQLTKVRNGSGGYVWTMPAVGAYLWTMPASEPGGQGKVFGDTQHRLAKLFEGHHVLHQARAVDELKRIMAGSPFDALTIKPDSLVFDGVSIGPAVKDWANRAVTAMNPDVGKLDRESVELRQELEPLARANWAAIRKRNATLPREQAWIGHMLSACDQAPMVVLQADKDVLLDAIFSLGAGRVVCVIARRLTGDRKGTLNFYESDLQHGRWSPLRPRGSTRSYFELDGGDVHLWFWDGYVELLEGTAIPARTRRLEREAAAMDD